MQRGRAPAIRLLARRLGSEGTRGQGGRPQLISSIHGGCVVYESWKGTGGVTGTSFNVYDPGKKKWRQTWVDSTGGVLDLEGELRDGRMVLASTPASKSDAINRITWERLPDGRVRQLWETSADGGTTWKVAFDGYYSKQ
jgi:hypothetical protein